MSSQPYSTTTTTTDDSATPPVRGRGRLRLEPIPGSVDRSTHVVDIALHHDPHRLALGDLRRAAEQLMADTEFEKAYRLWMMVVTAAERVDQSALAAVARAQADGAQHRAKFLAAASERRKATAVVDRSSTKYDYEALAAAVADGVSKTAAARRFGCSPSTIQRAVDYVNQRDDLLEESPEVLDQLMAGIDLQTVAERYDVSPRVLRWMVSNDFDRRS